MVELKKTLAITNIAPAIKTLCQMIFILLQIRDEHRGKTRLNQSNPKYVAMVRSMDENVGRISTRLEEIGLSENTIIVLTSDNGGLTTTRNFGPTSVLPLRAGKG